MLKANAFSQGLIAPPLVNNFDKYVLDFNVLFKGVHRFNHYDQRNRFVYASLTLTDQVCHRKPGR